MVVCGVRLSWGVCVGGMCVWGGGERMDWLTGDVVEVGQAGDVGDLDGCGDDVSGREVSQPATSQQPT